MSGKSIIFYDKRINKSPFNKNKKLIQIDNVEFNKILVSKKEPYGHKGSFKYVLDMMIMMILGHYAQMFLK